MKGVVLELLRLIYLEDHALLRLNHLLQYEYGIR